MSFYQRYSRSADRSPMQTADIAGHFPRRPTSDLARPGHSPRLRAEFHEAAQRGSASVGPPDINRLRRGASALSQPGTYDPAPPTVNGPGVQKVLPSGKGRATTPSR
ncbi:MAG: hypothetical protein IT450_15635 [Phycisphaerales bacterium]|nr:hypothetical protein [Phycisphaerales bacterium]